MLSSLRRHLAGQFGVAVRLGFRPPQFTPSFIARYDDITLGWDDEPAIKEAVRRVYEHTLTPWERLASLWQQVRYLDRYGLDGSLVECGVWRGGSAGLMALAHLASGSPTRKLHLFDSFQGMPVPSERDSTDAFTSYAEFKAKAPVSDVQRLLETIGYPPGLIQVHEGWFEDTVPRADIGGIALLRLDGDWYDSTMICLRNLEPLVVPYGIVVMDDYGTFEGCRRATDEYISGQKHPIYLTHLDFSARAWVKH